MSYNRGVLGPWEWWRKAALFAILAITVFLFLFVTIPAGVLVLAGLVAAAALWRPIGITNPQLGTYMVNTFPYRVARFFMAYEARRWQVLAPRVSIGLGPPTPDEDHKLQPGWWPPLRLSGYWALVTAVPLGYLDVVLHRFRMPFWGAGTLPELAFWALSALGWYMAIQSVLAVLRMQAGSPGILSVEAAPATMLRRVNLQGSLPGILGKSVMVGLAPAFLLVVLWFLLQPVPLPVMVALVAGVLSLTALVTLSRLLQRAYLQQWDQRNQRREFWSGALSFLKNSTPILVSEIELPTLDEWKASRTEDNAEEPYAPDINVATFRYPPSCTYHDYLGVEGRINGGIDALACAVAPVGKVDPDSGAELPGTAGHQGMRVWWSRRQYEPRDLINPTLNSWTREFAVRTLVMPAVVQTRGLGYCHLVSCGMITRKASKTQVLEVKLVPPVGVNLSGFYSALPALTENIGLPWLRVYQSSAADGTTVITLMVGENPEADGTRFINPPSIVRKIIDRSDWGYFFHVNRLYGPTGTPTLLTRRPSTSIVDELVFDLPSGMSYDTVSSRVPELMTTSGMAFLETTLGGELDTTPQRKQLGGGARAAQLAQAAADSGRATKFTVIASKEDPLARVFSFSDYQDRVITGREPGVAKLDWSPGVLANDQLATYRWDDELPHLLIAGASGTGKSVIGNSMLTQMVANNGPSELNLYIVEPKNELQPYRDLDVTKEFVDTWSPNEEFYTNVADLLERACHRMNNRYRAMQDHPKKPKKLSKAREIAHREGPLPDGSRHPLDLPFEVVIIEECATVFAESASKAEREEQGRILYYSAELARKARAAGIYLVCLTQYPTNASIPSVIRNQMRRIGLGCQNSLASRVIIDQNGLEQIRTKGVGMVTGDMGAFRKFRGYYLLDGDRDAGEVNDVLDVLEALPTTGTHAHQGWGGTSPLIVPTPDDMVFNAWSRHSGMKLDQAINGGRPTKDRLPV